MDVDEPRSLFLEALYFTPEDPMSTFTLTNPETPAAETASSGDDFSILEQRVVRAVQLLKKERDARSTAEANAATLQQLLDEQSSQLAETEGRLRALEQEREQVRGRVERMMKQLDEVGS